MTMNEEHEIPALTFLRVIDLVRHLTNGVRRHCNSNNGVASGLEYQFHRYVYNFDRSGL